MKIYCEGCRYFKAFYGSVLDDFSCDHPNNMEKQTIETWMKITVEIKHKKHPREINFNNDCQWFRKRNPWAEQF